MELPSGIFDNSINISLSELREEIKNFLRIKRYGHIVQ